MRTLNKLFAFLALSASFLQADLKTDLISINTSMVELNSSIASVELTSVSMCAPLIALNKQTQTVIDAIIVTNNSFTSPITLDDETLVLAEDLFTNVAALSAQTSFLSSDITLLAPTTDAITLGEGIRAVLQLSSDIGEMADRIGEMADNILIMSDNIGLMADRIVQMQVIQSDNLLLTQNSVLATQTNALSLVAVAETASYDLNLDSLVADGNVLVAKMLLVSLTPWNMSSKLEDIQTEVNDYFLKVQQFQEILNTDADQNTMYINSDSLSSLVNLTLVMTSLSTAMDGYGIMIESIQVLTSDRTLGASMESMLSMSADIGKMSNSILEMADVILLMSDNIGLEADQILLTQEWQSMNIAAAQTSVLAAQLLAIGIIASID
jgi:hypothetical protein